MSADADLIRATLTDCGDRYALEALDRLLVRLTTDKAGHVVYDSRISFGEFERILLGLGASGSDVKRLWPVEAERPVWPGAGADERDYSVETP